MLLPANAVDKQGQTKALPLDRSGDIPSPARLETRRRRGESIISFSFPFDKQSTHLTPRETTTTMFLCSPVPSWLRTAAASSCQQRFGARCILRPPSATTARSASSVTTSSERPAILELPVPFLWASDAANFDAVTHQRTDVTFDGHSGKPAAASTLPYAAVVAPSSPRMLQCEETTTGFCIQWQDGNESVFSKEWVNDQLQLWKTDLHERILWTNLDEAAIRESSTLTMPFAHLLTEAGMQDALRTLYQYGILLVQETPVDDNGVGVAALGAALGGGAVKNQLSIWQTYQEGSTDLVLPHGTDGPLRTLYGTVWATSSASQAAGSSTADSAYGTEGLPLHTDMTYHRDPPGLQIFTMVHPATVGGASIFADGFAAAERLRESDPQAFALLSSISRRYRSKDSQTGWHLEATSPVIGTDEWGRLLYIRHNDLDRLPDLPPPHLNHAEVAAFYKELRDAHQAWDHILGDDATRLVMPLQSGDTMVVANQRCFHGRFGFQVATTGSPRSVTGCYVSQDELNSRFRIEGFVVP